MRRIVLFIIVSLATAGVVFYSVSQSNRASNLPHVKGSNNIHTVSLLNDKADPDIVLAKVDDYVQFNAKDGKEHNLAQGSGNAVDKSHEHKEAGLESGIFKSDEAYKVQFKKVGIYAFHDHYNPDIYIRVVVNDRNK